ncbi:hypothetical protein MDUV_05840 [Mycolicibacterium duvalii]|uniref:Uncharacterized protein n=1 Tax=Mycolicibacterium duvalii TaxID=39688 RepID=A0A7I7JWP9_9MYCO|nr:hypothetical protein MDUV_05840 [Mycolicibacterium duvalii]
MLTPRKIQVLQKNPPGHRVDGHVVHDQCQLPGGLCPHRRENDARRRIQPRPRPGHCPLGERTDDIEAVIGCHRTAFGYSQRPGPVVIDAQPQHRVPVQQCLQQNHDIRAGGAGGCLHDHRLIELVGRAVDVPQPLHDRGRQHLTDTVVGRVDCRAAEFDDARQSGDGLLDEDVAWSAGQSGGAGLGDDLHGQDAVAAEVEEGVVDADAVAAEDVRVDAGEGFLRGVGGGTVRGDGAGFGRG